MTSASENASEAYRHVADDEPYVYESLPSPTSFRVAELLPGDDGDLISCLLHTFNWSNLLEYEAISYAWGNPNARAPVSCDGKIIEVTQNLHEALTHFRSKDRSRYLWADALCINQSDIPERGLQVKQMKKIYENAKTVLIWIGPDAEDHLAKLAVDSIQIISNFLCVKLGISVSEQTLMSDTYQETVLKHRHDLPLPNECEFSTDAMWKSLVWFYSHPYFTRVWVIQEIGANRKRKVHCGHDITEWNRVDLVASYIIMEPAFSDNFGFSGAYCWWAATVAELVVEPTRWLNILYLASNYSCLDARDVIYGLRGLMQLSNGSSLLDPDYYKSTLEVYRDSVEAAFVNFGKADVLLYITGQEDPSWIPRWEIPMLFRNPFRFGKPVPWRPAGETKPVWDIDKKLNILSLSGFIVDSIEYAESYNQNFFANSTIDSNDGRIMLNGVWRRILHTLETSQSYKIPFTRSLLLAVAVCLSFGLNHKIKPSEELEELLHNFVAYLRIAFTDDIETLSRYISHELFNESKNADGHTFGKPVWDFNYPESSLFVTQEKLIGCAVSATRPGDTVCVALGSTYPFVLRPDDDQQQLFVIRGFAYVNGIMDGERRRSETRIFKIR